VIIEVLMLVILLDDIKMDLRKVGLDDLFLLHSISVSRFAMRSEFLVP